MLWDSMSAWNLKFVHAIAQSSTFPLVLLCLYFMTMEGSTPYSRCRDCLSPPWVSLCAWSGVVRNLHCNVPHSDMATDDASSCTGDHQPVCVDGMPTLCLVIYKNTKWFQWRLVNIPIYFHFHQSVCVYVMPTLCLVTYKNTSFLNATAHWNLGYLPHMKHL